jgi:hypothetical protein
MSTTKSSAEPTPSKHLQSPQNSKHKDFTKTYYTQPGKLDADEVREYLCDKFSRIPEAPPLLTMCFT